MFLYFEDNAGVIVNAKGEMKGSAVNGPCVSPFSLSLKIQRRKEKGIGANDGAESQRSVRIYGLV